MGHQLTLELSRGSASGARVGAEAYDQVAAVESWQLSALEYGLSDMWWGVRLTRTAPVSREMILNYVAEHSLGLPRSY